MSYLKTRQTGSKTRLLPNLTRLDRCDAACPAAALNVATSFDGMKDPTLLFCNHHANKYEAELSRQGFSLFRGEDND